MSREKLLFVPVGPEALTELIHRAEIERRRPQDEAALLLERALGLGATTESQSLSAQLLSPGKRSVSIR